MSPHPWHRFNLTANPMGQLDGERIARAAVSPATDDCVEWLRHPRHGIEWIGPRGHGKTTAMLAVAASLPNAAYHYHPPDGPPPPIVDADVILIDEIQRMPRQALHRVLATGRPLGWTTHRSRAARLRRAGYQVRVIRVAAESDADRLQQVLDRRIEMHRYRPPPTPVPVIDRFLTESLWDLHRGDYRAAINHLYDIFQAAAIDPPPSSR